MPVFVPPRYPEAGVLGALGVHGFFAKVKTAARGGYVRVLSVAPQRKLVRSGIPIPLLYRISKINDKNQAVLTAESRYNGNGGKILLTCAAIFFLPPLLTCLQAGYRPFRELAESVFCFCGWGG